METKEMLIQLRDSFHAKANYPGPRTKEQRAAFLEARDQVNAMIEKYNDPHAAVKV